MNISPAEAAAVRAPPPWLRGAVRDLLERAPAYVELDTRERTALARAVLQVSEIAAALIAEEQEAQAQIDARAKQPPPLARAQEQPGFGAAADRIADTTRNVLGAVSFPRFVTDLVNGVFRSMLDSTSQQMQMYVNLLNSVSASLEGFEKSQTSLDSARQWVAEHFPDAIEYEAPDLEPGEEPDPDDPPQSHLRLRPGASMPDEEQIRGTLGLGPEAPVDASNPEQLVPLARRAIARQRQSMLSTMVQMGMQRIVIESGKINAAMRFHIDTRSVASEDRGSQVGMQNRIRASGSYGVGPWGVSAEVENSISFVSTQRSQATEEINTDLELNSSVELNFRTDYLPLNRMAGPGQAERIRGASLNPAAEGGETPADRRTRQDAQRKAEEQRRQGLLTMPAMPPPTQREPPRPQQPEQPTQEKPAQDKQPAKEEKPTQQAQPKPKEKPVQAQTATKTQTAAPQKASPKALTLAVVEALDKKSRTPSPPPRGKASDALGKQIIELLWRPLEETDDEGIWQRIKELRAVFDTVPDGEAGALLARLERGGNLQRDFDYRLHRASRRRLRASLRARARPDPKDKDLPVTPIPPAPVIPPHALPPYVPPPVAAPAKPDPKTGLSPQFIVGWKWASERRRSALLNKMLGKVPVLARMLKLVEPYFMVEAIPRVRAAVPGNRVVETKLLFDASGISGEIEADLAGLPGTAKFEFEGGKPSAKLSVKGSISRFELQMDFNADGVLGAARGLLPGGPPLARLEGKTVVEFGRYDVPRLDVPVTVECELIVAAELRWSLGGIIREIGDRIDPWGRIKDWARRAAARLLALWGRRIWWVVGAGLLLWWLLDDDAPPDDDLERFDPDAWRDAHRWAERHPQHDAIRDAIDEAADAAQESFGTGLADTLRHLQQLGNRASAQLETMASGPYGADHGFGNLPDLGDPFDRWFAWVQTGDASRERRSSIDLGEDDWRTRMRIVQRVAMAGRAARACGKLSRDGWIALLAKIKWHANAAGIACAVQFLRGWRDGNDFTFVDEKGKRQKHEGERYLTDAFKVVAADRRSDDEKRERARRIAWMILAE